MTDTALVADLAHRLRLALADDPTSLAWHIARYQAATETDDEQTAEFLGVSVATLDRIALCGPPRIERAVSDIEAVAVRFGADVGALAWVIWHGE